MSFEDLLPGKPVSEPPIPRFIHHALQKYRMKNEYALCTKIAGAYNKECTDPYHNHVAALQHYFRVVDPITAMDRLDTILSNLPK